VTHDNRILDLADRIVTLEDGRLVSLASEMSINAGSILRGFTRLSRTGDLRQHVGSLSDKQFADLLEALTSEFSQYLAVFQVGGRETIQELFDSILEATTAKMIDLMQADRGTLYLLDADKMILRSRIATGNAGEKIVIEVPVSHSLAGQVIRTGKPLNLDDVYQSENFNRAHDDATGYRTKSMLCMPIYTPAGHVLAVAQLINRKGDEKFSAADEERFIQFAEPLEVMLENCIQLQSQFLAATEAP
jgi:adenylate cyclase